MAEPLTNVIFASILYLIRQDLTGNRHRRAPPRQAHAHRRLHHICRSEPRAVNTTPLYQSMESSPPRSSKLPLPPFGIPYTPSTTVDLGRLTRPPKGITPFTVVGSRRGTPDMRHKRPLVFLQQRVKGGHRQWTCWSGARLISRSVTGQEPPTTGQIHHHQRQTPETLTLMGRASILHQASPHLETGHPPGRRHRCTSFRLNGVTSLVLLVEPGDGGGGAAQRSGKGDDGGGWI
jgi:hypothetical protein